MALGGRRRFLHRRDATACHVRVLVDAFITRFVDKTIEPAYVTFDLDADGKIERITMKSVSPLADFSYDYQDLLFQPLKIEKK